MTVPPIADLPLGFRFRPTDEELVNHYLKGKIKGRKDGDGVIPEVDVCKWEPWELPGKSLIPSGDPEWFFFCPCDRKYPNGQRLNRATGSGYWKATGKDRKIKTKKEPKLIGTKKTLVFYLGRAPGGKRMSWVMHEYHAVKCEELNGLQDAFVLCRLFKKPEENGVSYNCDLVDPSGLSPTASKSIADEDVGDEPFDSPREEKLVADTGEVQHTAAATVEEEQQDQIDVVQTLEQILDVPSDSPLENGTTDSNYMADQEPDASSLFNEPVFESLEDVYFKGLSTRQSFNICSPFEGGYGTSMDNMFLFHDNVYRNYMPSDSSMEAADEMFDVNDIPFGESPGHRTLVGNVEDENETGIEIRIHEPTRGTNQVLPTQGIAHRRIRLQVHTASPSTDTDHEKKEVPRTNCFLGKERTLIKSMRRPCVRSYRPKLKITRLRVAKADTSHENGLEVAGRAVSDNVTHASFCGNASVHQDFTEFQLPHETQKEENSGSISATDEVMKGDTLERSGSVYVGANDIINKSLFQQDVSKPRFVIFLVAAITLLSVVLAVVWRFSTASSFMT